MARVLYIWQSGYPWDVRAEKICLELVRRGCEVTLLARCEPGQAPEAWDQGIRIVRVGHGLPRAATVPLPVNPVWRKAIHSIVAEWGPHLVIAREILLAEPAGRACRESGIPMVMDMAEHYPAAMKTWDKYRRHLVPRFLVFEARLPERVERRAMALSDGIITVCEEQNHRLDRTYGTPAERMAIVHNTPELSMFDAVKLGSNRPPLNFAHHGHMTSMRGMDRLVQGFAQAARQEPDIQLILAGTGDVKPLAEIARREGVEGRVHFKGPYQHDDLVGLYGETDVGMVAYPASEALEHTIPNKIFDYMAAGKPLVVTPIGPFRRVVEECGAGLVLDGESPESIGQGIAQMCRTDPEPMSQGGRRGALERYHWGRDAEALVSFLGRFVSMPAPAFS